MLRVCDRWERKEINREVWGMYLCLEGRYISLLWFWEGERWTQRWECRPKEQISSLIIYILYKFSIDVFVSLYVQCRGMSFLLSTSPCVRAVWHVSWKTWCSLEGSFHLSECWKMNCQSHWWNTPPCEEIWTCFICGCWLGGGGGGVDKRQKTGGKRGCGTALPCNLIFSTLTTHNQFQSF